MALTVQLRPSADAANALRMDSSGALATEGLTPSQFAFPGATIDNSFASAAANTTTYYPLPTGGTSQANAINNTATFQQITLTRDARITDAYLNFTAIASGSTWTVYGSVYSADATTGLPAVKVTDLLRFTSATVTAIGVYAATILDSTTVFTGHTRYWLTTWGVTSSAFPGATLRVGSGTLPSRQNATPTVYPNGQALALTATGWTHTAAPATVTMTAASPTTAVAPHYWLGVRNT